MQTIAPQIDFSYGVVRSVSSLPVSERVTNMMKKEDQIIRNYIWMYIAQLHAQLSYLASGEISDVLQKELDGIQALLDAKLNEIYSHIGDGLLPESVFSIVLYPTDFSGFDPYGNTKYSKMYLVFLDKVLPKYFQKIRNTTATLRAKITQYQKERSKGRIQKGDLSFGEEVILITDKDNQSDKTISQPSNKAEITLNKIQTRLDNIMKQQYVYVHNIDELRKMSVRLNNLQKLDGNLLCEITSVQEIVAALLETGSDDTYMIPTTSTKASVSTITSTQEILIEEHQQNQATINFIRDIRSNVLTYKLSSKKGGESIGDGNFIAHVWRPFLALFESCMKSGRIDSHSFSWKELTEQIYRTHDGIKGRARLQVFLDILLKSDSLKGNLSQNWETLVKAVQEFSTSLGFYRKTNGVIPLSNFLQILKANPPPSR